MGMYPESATMPASVSGWASADVQAIISLALSEDVGRGDLTTEATVSPDALASAEVSSSLR